MRRGGQAGSRTGRGAKAAPAFPVARAHAAAVLLALGLPTLLLSGCGETVEKKVGFSLPSHAAWQAKGNAAIDGEGFLRRPNGWLARCSGGFVYLVPASDYFREIIEVYRKGDRLAASQNLEGVNSPVVRKTQCNMQGKFAFSELPPGKWIAFTRIDYDGAEWLADLTLVGEVETKAGTVTKTILSNPNRI